MDAQKVDLFMVVNGKFFESYQVSGIRDRLLAMDEAKWVQIQSLQFKDPMLIQLVSLMSGHFGVDRFLVGDVGLGIAKLLTCGGCGVWTLVDWFLIQSSARERNLIMFSNML